MVNIQWYTVFVLDGNIMIQDYHNTMVFTWYLKVRLGFLLFKNLVLCSPKAMFLLQTTKIVIV